MRLSHAMNSRPIRVGILDSHALVRDGLSALLQRGGEFECIGSWSQVNEAIHAIRRSTPDIVLLGLNGNTPEASRIKDDIAAASPSTRLIVMIECSAPSCPALQYSNRNGLIEEPLDSANNLSDECRRLVQDLTDTAVLPKASSFHHIADRIRELHGSGHHSCVSIMGENAIQTTAFPFSMLTAREKQVAALIARGFSNKDISAELEVSYSTVKNHVSSILKKLDLDHRTQIAVYAISRATVMRKQESTKGVVLNSH